MPAFRPDIPPHIADIIRHLPPDIKQGIKFALRALSQDPHCGVPLERELKGLWKYRVRRYRIVYSADTRHRLLRILAVGHRRRVYEDVLKEIEGR